MSIIPRNFFKFFRFSGLVLGAALVAACDQTAGFGGAPTKSVNAQQTVKVALLVPLESGQSELTFLGSSLVNAANLAKADIGGVDLDIAVYPTGGDAGKAAVAAQRAISEGAQVFVGPLFSTAAASVAPLAAQNGLSVLSFSNNSEIAGNNLYLLGLTFDTVARRVVSYSIGKGNRDIAVIHSADPAGAAGLRAARNAIQTFGGNFVGAYPYELSPEGISSSAPAIARQVRAAGASAAVLTDDPGAGLTFLTPVLATGGLTTRNTDFLGLTRWNIPSQAASTPSMQSGYFAAPDPSVYAQFESRYMSTFGSSPHPLAGLAYDGIAAVGAMVQNARASGTGALTPSQITNPKGFAGVNGVFRFKSNGGNDRGLALFQLRDGQPVLVDSAPRGFGGSGS